MKTPTQTAGFFALAALACSMAQADNVVKGDCTALKTYIANTGVQDAGGTQHRGKAGWTLPGFGIAPNYTDPQSTANPGAFCFTATAHPEFTADPAIRTLDWQPSGCNICACQFDRDRWTDGILKREQHNAGEDQALAKDANASPKRRRSFQVKACFPSFDPAHTRQDAIQAWNAQVATAMADSLDALERRAARAAAIYDREFGDSPPCDNCKPCGVTEVAQCNACAACNRATGVCEAMPGCIPPETCCCWKYVVGQQGCQVGTIEKSACEAMNVPNAVTAQCSFPCSYVANICN